MSAPTLTATVERAVASIMVGDRHRKDMGDLGPLIDSIREHGLLQPITVSIDGHLIVGARRLAAVKALGWRTVRVWVRNISDRLGVLLAERDDNTLHKPLNDVEAATLYREIKAMIARDAARRQEAARFGAGGETPGPWTGQVGDAREQAARMVTGRSSYQALERVNRVQDLALDNAQPEHVRLCAVAELSRIAQGGSVNSAHHRMQAELAVATLDRVGADTGQSGRVRENARRGAVQLRRALAEGARTAELRRLSQEAIARVEESGPAPKGKKTATPLIYPMRTFEYTWNDLASWWDNYDPTVAGPALSQERWEQFEATVAGTVAFYEAARAARQAAASGESEATGAASGVTGLVGQARSA
jgi:ParB family chromosome partitioning protein